jgi:glycerophosphoryl diester phosphodiesterase
MTRRQSDTARAGANVPWRPAISAHRGGALLWPENSPTAFRNAARLPVTSIETDIHLSRDGAPIVIHDATLERTTTGRGPARAHTLAALRRLTLRRTRHERIPTLAEILCIIRPSARGLRLEVKVDANKRRYPGIERKAAQILRAAHMLHRTTVTSFNWPTLAAFHRVARPFGLVGLMTETTYNAIGGFDAMIERVRRFGLREVSIPNALVTRDLVLSAWRAGVRLGAYRIKTAADTDRALAAGVSTFTTDRPDISIARHRVFFRAAPRANCKTAP